MRRSLLLILVLVCATASAQVFRRIGPDGQVYFSDQPGPDAEQVEVKPAQAISLPPLPRQTGATQPQHEAGAAYSAFTIVSPTAGQGVRANDGNVTVSLSLKPKLMPGHTVMLNVDGEDAEQYKTGDGLTVALSNLSRGLHTVEATVVDAQGKALIQTGPVSFNVLRVAAGGR